MSDYISRKAVIEVLNGTIAPPSVMLDTLVKRIEELPTAQRWIPCSDRLPQSGGWYLITTDCKDFEVTTSWYSTLHGWEWKEQVKPIAWMPLPEPYTEDSNAND